MSNALECLPGDDLTIELNIFRQTSRIRPHDSRLVDRSRIHWNAPSEPRRNVIKGAVNQNGHWIQVSSDAPQSQPLSFERNRTTSGEGIEDGRDMDTEILVDRGHLRQGTNKRRIIRSRVRESNLLPSESENVRVCTILPLNQVSKDSKQAGTLLILLLLAGESIRPCRRVIDELRKQDAARCDEWSTGPPLVDGRRVALPK